MDEMIDPRQAMLEEVESHTYAHAPKGRAESAVGYVGKIDLEALKHPNGVGRIVAYAQFDATIPLFATPPARDGAEGAGEYATICHTCGETLGSSESCDLAECPRKSAPPEPPPDAMREANRERQQRIAELKERAAQRCEGCRLSWRLHGWAHGEPMPIECNAKEERQQLRAISAPVPSDDRPLYASPPVRGDRQAVAQANLIRDSIQHTYDEMCVQFSGVHSDDKTDSWLLNLYSSLRLLSLPVQPNLPLGKATLYTILSKHVPSDMIDGIWQEINEAIEVKP